MVPRGCLPPAQTRTRPSYSTQGLCPTPAPFTFTPPRASAHLPPMPSPSSRVSTSSPLPNYPPRTSPHHNAATTAAAALANPDTGRRMRAWPHPPPLIGRARPASVALGSLLSGRRTTTPSMPRGKPPADSQSRERPLAPRAGEGCLHGTLRIAMGVEAWRGSRPGT